MSLQSIQALFDATTLKTTVTPLDLSLAPEDAQEAYQIEGLYLTKEKRERSNILESYLIDAWVVSYDIQTPASYWEPEDYDYHEVGDFQNLTDAVREICNLIIQKNLQAYHENEWAKEYANVQPDQE